MAVQSIGTPVQIGHVAGDHLFVAARQMPFREVHRISQIDHTAQEVWPNSEALDDAGNLLSPRAGSPKVIRRSRLSGGFSIFDDSNFGRRFGDWSAICARRVVSIVVGIHIVGVGESLFIQNNPEHQSSARRRLRRPVFKTDSGVATS